MLKRKLIAIIILATMIFSFVGCSDKESTDVIKNENVQDVDNDDESEDIDGNVDIPEEILDNESQTDQKQELSMFTGKSKDLALQILDGDFTETMALFSSEMKRLISEDQLKQAWNLTTTDMGTFKALRSVTEETKDTASLVYVILDYDITGIQILFSYNANKKLNGLWFNYAPFETELMDNDFFEEANISFGDKNNPIEGILTLPKEVKNPPVAILVHGSGDHDADESIGVNKPFRDLAYGLANKGVAVIRYKESSSRKAKEEYTIQDDSLYDAAEAIKYALSCGKVDKDRIVLVGHSLGGMMAPKIAMDNIEVAGIVSLAGSPRRLEDIILDQNSILLQADDSITDLQYRLYMARVKSEVDKVKKIKKSGSEVILGYPASYWYSLNQIDTPSLVKELDIPMFIAQGNDDFQVYADIDYVEWQGLLKDKDNVIFKLYDNLNHLFMESNGRMDTTEYNIKGNVSQILIEDLAKWILSIKD